MCNLSISRKLASCLSTKNRRVLLYLPDQVEHKYATIRRPNNSLVDYGGNNGVFSLHIVITNDTVSSNVLYS